MSTWDEVIMEGESELRASALGIECEHLTADFVRHYQREPTAREEIVLWDRAYRTVYRAS